MSIYTLEEDELKDEVRSFISDLGNRRTCGYIKGFIQLINQVAEGKWPHLHEELRKCWEQDGIRLCELRKGCWRISCFLESGRLVLGTVFRKSKMKQKKEYNRAAKAFKRFMNNPEWVEV